MPEGYRLAGLRILAREEDLARELLASLGEKQRVRTIVDPDAPADLVTQAARHIKLDDPAGLPVSEMKTKQKKILLDLISVYLHRMPEDIAYSRMNQIERKGPFTFTLPGREPRSMDYRTTTGCRGQAFWLNTIILRTMQTTSIRYGGIRETIGGRIFCNGTTQSPIKFIHEGNEMPKHKGSQN